jgi:hypothetical protein
VEEADGLRRGESWGGGDEGNSSVFFSLLVGQVVDLVDS